MPAAIDAITFSLKLVMYRKALSEKMNDATPAAPDRTALLSFCAAPSLLLEIALPSSLDLAMVLRASALNS